MDRRYLDYLKSDHWNAVKSRYYQSKLPRRDKFGRPVCEVCGTYGRLDLHHKSYKRLGHEKLHDFALLCRDCHHELHDLYRVIKAQNRRAGLWGILRILKRKQNQLTNGD